MNDVFDTRMSRARMSIYRTASHDDAPQGRRYRHGGANVWTHKRVIAHPVQLVVGVPPFHAGTPEEIFGDIGAFLLITGALVTLVQVILVAAGV